MLSISEEQAGGDCHRQEGRDRRLPSGRTGCRTATHARRPRRHGLRVGRPRRWLMRYGIPEYKLEKATLKQRLAQMHPEGMTLVMTPVPIVWAPCTARAPRRCPNSTTTPNRPRCAPSRARLGRRGRSSCAPARHPLTQSAATAVTGRGATFPRRRPRRTAGHRDGGREGRA